MSGAGAAGRPTVEEVALLIRSRTKDSLGNEIGTFDDETRPTADQVEEQIDAAAALVGMRLPPMDELADELLPAVAHVVAYRAALRIEKSYFPEQVRTDRSAYEQLLGEYESDLEALVSAASAGGTAFESGSDIAMIPVESWTGGGCVPCPPETDAA
jgi:hypothetical protein